MTVSPITHGTLTGYAARGCRCDPCRKAGSEYHNRRREKLAKDPMAGVIPIRPRKKQSAKFETSSVKPKSPECGQVSASKDVSDVPLDTTPGETEEAVVLETQSLSASENHPGMVATAKRMARILDNPDLVKLHPTSSRQLMQILESLRSKSQGRRRGGRLASVQQMTARRGDGQSSVR